MKKLLFITCSVALSLYIFIQSAEAITLYECKGGVLVQDPADCQMKIEPITEKEFHVANINKIKKIAEADRSKSKAPTFA